MQIKLVNTEFLCIYSAQFAFWTKRFSLTILMGKKKCLPCNEVTNYERIGEDIIWSPISTYIDYHMYMYYQNRSRNIYYLKLAFHLNTRISNPVSESILHEKLNNLTFKGLERMRSLNFKLLCAELNQFLKKNNSKTKNRNIIQQ